MNDSGLFYACTLGEPSGSERCGQCETTSPVKNVCCLHRLRIKINKEKSASRVVPNTRFVEKPAVGGSKSLVLF